MKPIPKQYVRNSDHIYTNTNFSDLPIAQSTFEDISDHLPINAEFRCMPRKNAINRSFVCNFRREKIDLFLANLSNTIKTTEMWGNNDLNKL